MIPEWIGSTYMSGSYPRLDIQLVMKYAAASDRVIYKKKTSNGKCVDGKGECSLTAIHKKVKASMENVNDAGSQPDKRKTRK
jgi:hypothetical protein